MLILGYLWLGYSMSEDGNPYHASFFHRACYNHASKADPFPTGECIEDVRWRTAICDLDVRFLKNYKYDRATPNYKVHYNDYC